MASLWIKYWTTECGTGEVYAASYIPTFKQRSTESWFVVRENEMNEQREEFEKQRFRFGYFWEPLEPIDAMVYRF